MNKNLPAPKPIVRRNISREEIIHICGRMLSKNQDVVTTTGLSKLGIPYSQINKHFGGINNLRKLLGLPISKNAREWTDEKLLNFVLKLAITVGRTPTHRDVDFHGKRLLGSSPLSAIKRHFGGVRNAYRIAYACKMLKNKKLSIPYNEEDLKRLFWQIHTELGFICIEVGNNFPDALLIRDGKTYKTEFEYYSSNFVKHRHDIKKVDLIICWMHDWEDCPVEVLEVKKLVSLIKLVNRD